MRRHTESAPHAPPADSASVGTSISNPCCFNCRHLLARWSVAQLAMHSKRHAAETLDAGEEVVSEDGPRPSPVDEVDEQQHEDGPRPSPIDEVDGQHEDGPDITVHISDLYSYRTVLYSYSRRPRRLVQQ